MQPVLPHLPSSDLYADVVLVPPIFPPRDVFGCPYHEVAPETHSAILTRQRKK